MINSSFQGIDSKFYEDLQPTEQDELWSVLSNMLEDILWIARNALSFITTKVSKFIDLSFKMIGAAVDVTILKVQELTANISQLNLNIINLAPQTSVHYHVVNHYHMCSHCVVQEKINRQPLGLVY